AGGALPLGAAGLVDVHVAVDQPGQQHLVLGVAAAAAGLGPADAGQAAAYLSITGSATAAQRLLAMDPITVATVTARLVADVDDVASRAAGVADVDPAWLPADTDPLLDLLAEVHADRGDRYFAS
ncbi:urease accessory UreF family protein, partial [Klenkia sp. PcliD-1-E]|uniref:urease accessory UreF family protein n=1 Tax=Klenkia sp. PcliD-1-E TaxID=2954492 RepID=UPI0035ABBF32|nr:hypothetical protein [Klenkia sp. PcliD-1-E]